MNTQKYLWRFYLSMSLGLKRIPRTFSASATRMFFESSSRSKLEFREISSPNCSVSHSTARAICDCFPTWLHTGASLHESSFPRTGMRFARKGKHIANTDRIMSTLDENVTIATDTPRSIAFGIRSRKKGLTSLARSSFEPFHCDNRK